MNCTAFAFEPPLEATDSVCAASLQAGPCWARLSMCMCAAYLHWTVESCSSFLWLKLCKEEILKHGTRMKGDSYGVFSGLGLSHLCQQCCTLHHWNPHPSQIRVYKDVLLVILNIIWSDLCKLCFVVQRICYMFSVIECGLHVILRNISWKAGFTIV